MDSDRDYSYEELLQRVFGIMRDKNPEMVAGEKKKFEPATGDPWLCGLVADIDEATGHCTAVKRLRLEMDRTDA